MERAVDLISSSNNRGFTLVEVLVAFVILLVGLLGLLQAINIALEHNTRNHFREEATLVGERVMNGFRALPFDQITATNGTLSVPSNIRGVNKSYRVTYLARAAGGSANSRELEVNVIWKFKNSSTVHRVKSVRTR